MLEKIQQILTVYVTCLETKWIVLYLSCKYFQVLGGYQEMG